MSNVTRLFPSKKQVTTKDNHKQEGMTFEEEIFLAKNKLEQKIKKTGHSPELEYSGKGEQYIKNVIEQGGGYKVDKDIIIRTFKDRINGQLHSIHYRIYGKSLRVMTIMRINESVIKNIRPKLHLV